MTLKCNTYDEYKMARNEDIQNFTTIAKYESSLYSFAVLLNFSMFPFICTVSPPNFFA